MSAARASAAGSLVSDRRRCACAMAPARGVRSSCAALAAKLRSASNAAFSRSRSEFRVAAMGAISVGRSSAGTDDRSRALRASSPSRKRCRGARLALSARMTARSATGITMRSGSPRPIWISRATVARWSSGSATVIRTVPCRASSL